MYKAVSDGITQDSTKANPDFQEIAEYTKLDFFDDFSTAGDGTKTLIGQRAEFTVRIFNDSVYDEDEIVILSLAEPTGAVLQTYDSRPCPIISGKTVCTTTLTIRDDGDAGSIVFLDQIGQNLSLSNAPPRT